MLAVIGCVALTLANSADHHAVRVSPLDSDTQARKRATVTRVEDGPSARRTKSATPHTAASAALPADAPSNDEC